MITRIYMVCWNIFNQGFGTLAGCRIGTCRLVGSNDQLPLLAALHACHHHSPMFLSILSAQLKTFFFHKQDFALCSKI